MPYLIYIYYDNIVLFVLGHDITYKSICAPFIKHCLLSTVSENSLYCIDDGLAAAPVGVRAGIACLYLRHKFGWLLCILTVLPCFFGMVSQQDFFAVRGTIVQLDKQYGVV